MRASQLFDRVIFEDIPDITTYFYSEIAKLDEARENNTGRFKRVEKFFDRLIVRFLKLKAKEMKKANRLQVKQNLALVTPAALYRYNLQNITVPPVIPCPGKAGDPV